MSAGKNNNSYTVHNSIHLVKGGSAYFTALKKLIANAKRSIYIRMYIWNEDQTGTCIAHQLIAAAQKNVSVFIIADGYASQGLSHSFISQLEEKGIRFRYFEPLLRSSHFYFGRRMHEKIVVADETTALIGGINFADRYNDVDSIPAWLDFSLLVKGEAAYELFKYCYKSWHNTMPALQKSSRHSFAESCSVRLRINDWVKGKQQIWHTYFNWFNQAEETISIMCSYFLPGRVLRKRLAMAAKRGVRVKLILAGPSDVPLAKYAERYLYRWLLKNGIEIYEYQPTVLHAKMMVVDNRWFTIGSYNVNNISAYASTEINLDVRNKPFAFSVEELMNALIEKDCIRIKTKSQAFKVGLFQTFIQRSSYELIRLILNLSTFYFKQE